ncbi:trypsin-like serine peptidase [Streptomyces sp. NPDC053048]|uniref:trypsin-like serine peptidase n=1 Tax=Streptomyces sp. NPDC053048 TaxID=3365694 RepID=UPI0037D0427E
MRRTRRIHLAVLPVTAAALLTAGGLGTAQAQSSEGRSADSTASSAARLTNGARVDSQSAAKEVERYWTAERMRNAIPLSDTAGTPAQDRRQQPAGKAGSVPPAAPSAGNRADLRVTESAAVGKVFFHNPRDGKNYSCSASALNSASKQLVLTAGHCVHGGRGGTWMTNWTYVPRYRDGNRPFGTFSAKQLRTFNTWIDRSDLGRDVGMVTTWPLNGRKLVNVTGGHGLSWNYNRSQDITALAYPSNKGGGKLQWYCQGRTSAAGWNLKIKCGFGPGASGGPWLRQYNNSSGLGYANGVMSTLRSDGYNESPYFDNGVKGMLDAQGGVT